MKMHFAAAAAALFVSPSIIGTAHAASQVPGVFSTGLDANGVALVGGNGQVDANYTFTATTGGATTGTQAVTYYIPAYIADSSSSRWVSYTADRGQMFVAANYTFTTTFDLAGFDSESASLSGFVGADNEATVFLNGTAIGGVYGYRLGTFQELTAFSTTDSALFRTGINTIDVVLRNVDRDAAVRIDGLTVTADALVAGVPEPATWALMIVGFGAVGGAMRRKQASMTSVRFA